MALVELTSTVAYGPVYPETAVFGTVILKVIESAETIGGTSANSAREGRFKLAAMTLAVNCDTCCK